MIPITISKFIHANHDTLLYHMSGTRKGNRHRSHPQAFFHSRFNPSTMIIYDHYCPTSSSSARFIWENPNVKLSINLAQRVNEGPKSCRSTKIYCLSSSFYFCFCLPAQYSSELFFLSYALFSLYSLLFCAAWFPNNNSSCGSFFLCLSLYIYFFRGISNKGEIALQSRMK